MSVAALSPAGVPSLGDRLARIDARMATITGRPATSAASTTPSAPASFAGQLATASAAAVPGTTPLGATTTSSTSAGASAGSVPFGAEIDAAAARYGIDPALLSGLIRQESGFDPGARSAAGAVGLTQLMPSTAAALGVTDPTDPAQSIDGGARYLRQQLDRFGGDPAKALAAYNAGPGAVAKYGGVPPYPETQHYVETILGGIQT